MLDLSRYTTPLSSWNGLYRYAQDHPQVCKGQLPDSFSEEDLLKVMKKQAREVLSEKEYDTFRKAVTSLRKGRAVSIKKENLYRLFFVLQLESDTEAQDLLMNYLHQSELSARALDDFIIIAALKMQLSWKETCGIRSRYAELIASQPMAPGNITEGQTAEVYYSIINDSIRTVSDLCGYLDNPENIAFFAKTCNTRYLALFDDVQLEVLYNGSQEEFIRIYANYGSLDRITIKEYYYSLFGISAAGGLSEEEIMTLSGVFENTFMSYDNFCLLVQRKRPVDVSSGTFLLGLFKKLLTEEQDVTEDFYVDFLNPEEFTEIINDILIYFGFPILNPDQDPFERLLMDTYENCLSEHADLSNAAFQQTFIQNLCDNLKELAAICRESR